ncbi:TonB-dependent receptor domain-containing protein [Undibacterium sp. Ren11W]|uniref:TonB-dependent receptor domain-containing protein n=1 Tax=Undibacterium sp. Ren11W TaxID=3413045 RepID=UPI003BF0FA39
MTSVFKPLAISFAVAAAFPTFSVFAEPTQNVVVTAGRQAQVAKDVLADNLVINAEEIAKSGAISVVDLLQKQRGIEIGRNGGPGTTASVFMRGGSNSQNAVFIDGVRIGSATSGGASWSTIPLSQIERIEVVYGPLSSLYGADAMSGVVQIFTKKGSRAIAPTASVGVGSYGLRRVEAGISGATESNFSFALNAGHETSEGFSATKPAAGPYSYNADKDGYTLDSVSGRLGLEVSKGFDLGLNFLQSRLDSQFDSGPGYDDRSEQKLETVALFGRAKLSSNWLSGLQLAKTADKGYTDASYGKSQIDTTQTSINWQNDINIGKDVLQLIVERRVEDVDGTTLALNRSRSTNSYAASYVLKRDAHLASASLRNDVSSQYGSHSTGSVAYGYRLTEALRLNASYGTSFRAPTYNELYYPSYGIETNKPETAKNAELGVYFDDNTYEFSAVYYQNKATDLLVSTNVCPILQATHKYGCAYNVDKATMSGLTIGANVNLGSINLRASLDIQDPVDDTTGKRLARRAKQHGTLAAEYSIEKLKFGAEGIFSGERYDDVANKKLLPGYGLLNLYATYDVAANWTVLARFNNALNKDYETAKNYATAASNIYVGVSYGFK